MISRVVIHRLIVSPGHNYFGHHGRPAGEHPSIERTEVVCRAGLGIEGDRFFGHKSDYKGQMTLFSWEVYEQAREHFNVPMLAPVAFRRNLMIEGANLDALIGARFSLGGVEFFGTEESRPCYWMNDAVAAGAEEWLRGNGGLRVRVLSDGILRLGPQDLEISVRLKKPLSLSVSLSAGVTSPSRLPQVRH